jgi:hypothetical protein
LNRFNLFQAASLFCRSKFCFKRRHNKGVHSIQFVIVLSFGGLELLPNCVFVGTHITAKDTQAATQDRGQSDGHIWFPCHHHS